MGLFKVLGDILKPKEDNVLGNLNDGVDEFLEGINEDQVDPKIQHIEVTVNVINNVDFITYDASGDKIHLILHVNYETGEYHVSDEKLKRIVIDSEDELMVYIDVIQKIIDYIKFSKDTIRLAEYYKNK